MSEHDNAWFVANAGNRERLMSEARALRAQAEEIRQQAQTKEREAMSLADGIEVFEGQAITLEDYAFYDGREHVSVGSLPTGRYADLYQTVGGNGTWSGQLKSYESQGQEAGYPRATYTGGLSLGYGHDRESILNSAKRWAAFAEIPEDVKRDHWAGF